MEEHEAEENESMMKFVVGNKIDLVSEREIQTQTGEDYAESIGAPFYEVSAKEDSNVNELF